ncbi:DUF747-domain-containing protein [Xylariaceae sp. FL0255]|nr:DUF747-domain-containing protein [Xylariaceae sp. FL0255]
MPGRIASHDERQDILTESRRPPTQCPTPPTDPFPDLDTMETEDAVTGESVDGGGGGATTTTTTTKPRSATRSSFEGVRKLSASQMQALASSPDSLPVAVVSPPHPQRKPNGAEYPLSAGAVEDTTHSLSSSMAENAAESEDTGLHMPSSNKGAHLSAADFQRPHPTSRTLSSPPTNRKPSSSSSSSSMTTPMNAPATFHGRRNSFNPLPKPAPLNLNGSNGSTKPIKPSDSPPSSPSIMPAIPLPPMSLPTHLQLELAGQRPSPLYIHHSQAADAPYESSSVKFERLLNALLLPPYLEKVMYFGSLACLDAWLYTFTILPMRFFAAIGVLLRWWLYVIINEMQWVVGFVWSGIGRLWRRGRRGRSTSRGQHDDSQPPSDTERSQSRARENSARPNANSVSRRRKVSDSISTSLSEQARSTPNGVFRPPKHVMPRQHFRHKRTKSVPSNLTSYHKADLLQGAVLICSSIALMHLDASQMYHFIRAQSSMKLYVIYNILEVADRLLGAIGQDILECLFSSETLSRNSSGRSKVLLPFGMFILSMIYNVIHTWCLFYQVITLNVAVNSYSNSLLTLLISNQFVEIKGSVFKKIEKENLFQLTCSDVVERFQTWIILLIIGMRNVVEVGGLSVRGSSLVPAGGASAPNPGHVTSILPASFTVLPAWLQSGEVLSPFIIVICFEMLVDWIKHAYINKFNNVKPTLYRRMLDILCKDYYTNAFSAPALTRRLGLPLLPLSCLFIRASFQVYHMFLITHLPPPIPTATTDISVESSTPSSAAMVAAFEKLDSVIRHALGRAVYGAPHRSIDGRHWWAFSSDDAIALFTMAIFFFLAWVVLLVIKLLLGMLLLRYSHRRYAMMKAQEHAIATGKAEHENFSQPGQRIGSWSHVEIGDERRKWLYEDDPKGLKKMRDREVQTQAKFNQAGEDGLARVVRYEMVGKRIW